MSERWGECEGQAVGGGLSVSRVFIPGSRPKRPWKPEPTEKSQPGLLAGLLGSREGDKGSSVSHSGPGGA